jgi:oxygen-independent coproporphyrinogen-3 oxidase
VIYVHIPFCRSFCTYCDFYSEIASRCSADEQSKFAQFSQALSKEAAQRAEEITEDINTLYIGGGTPSVLPLYVFEDLLQTLREHGHGGLFEEFTVEVNPEDIVQKGEVFVEGLLQLGVNRISMGVQSFDDSILKWMNRRHDAATARKAYHILENAGVSNISIDLIFGLSQLSDDQWNETLEKALGISSIGRVPQHISSYQLSVEPGSALAQLVDRGQWSEASEELCLRQYEMLCDRLRDAGYHHYEISNFAQPGYEAVHNSAYWKHHPYVGLGPGAHSYLMSYKRQWNESDLGQYLKAAKEGDFSALQGSEVLTDEQLAMEKVMLGLRTSAGVSEEFLRANSDTEQLEEAFRCGNLVSAPDGMIRIPENRFFISDNIISSII